jgi:hypothetical protein
MGLLNSCCRKAPAVASNDVALFRGLVNDSENPRAPFFTKRTGPQKPPTFDTELDTFVAELSSDDASD